MQIIRHEVRNLRRLSIAITSHKSSCQYGAQWLPSLCSTSKAPVWQSISNRFQLPPTGYRYSTPIFSMPGYKTWCQYGKKCLKFCGNDMEDSCFMSTAYVAPRTQFSASECLLPYFGKCPCNLCSTVTAMAENFSWGRLQQCLDGNGTVRPASPNKGAAQHHYRSVRSHGTNMYRVQNTMKIPNIPQNIAGHFCLAIYNTASLFYGQQTFSQAGGFLNSKIILWFPPWQKGCEYEIRRQFNVQCFCYI